MTGHILAIAWVVSAYWAVSITMVLVNKRLVSGGRIQSDISILLVWLQNLIGIGVILAARFLSKIFPTLLCPDLPRLRAQTLLRDDMLLASFAYTAMLISNNLMLRHISVSFYQIARSLSMIFVIILSAIILRERIIMKVFFPCFLIIFGFCIGVEEEILSHGLRPLGVVFGVASSFFGALAGIFCKRLQKRSGVSSLAFTYHTYLIGSAVLTPVVLLTTDLNNFVYSPEMIDLTFWVLLLLSGLPGLAMGWLSTLQISLTSPLTHIISTNAKSVFLTIIAVIWNSEKRSLFWWAGNVLVVGGILLYTSVKLQTEKHKQRINQAIEIEIKPNENEDRLSALSPDTHNKYRVRRL